MLRQHERSEEELQILSSKNAAKQALEKVKSYASGQPTLLTGWAKINELLIGGFRFGMIYTIAGASGHGKSYFLNQLQEHFFDPEMNGKFPYPVMWLHFSFEMAAADEVLRTASRHLGVPYSDLLSLEKRIDKELYLRFLEFVRNYQPPVHFVEKSGDIHQIWDTINRFKRLYPGHKLIISIDHILLAKALSRESDLDMMGSVVNSFVDNIDQDTMVILLAQLNADIEDPKRIQNPSLHYPLKRDIHGSKKLYHASDVVIVVHQPRELGIDSYGPKGIPTDRLVAVHCIKYRSGKTGFSRLWNDLDIGKFTDWSETKVEEFLNETTNMQFHL